MLITHTSFKYQWYPEKISNEQVVAEPKDSGSEKTSTKEVAVTATGKANSLVIPGYARIMVTHDGSGMSDKALDSWYLHVNNIQC